VLVGYGRVGRLIAEALEQRGVTYVVAEQNRDLVEQLRRRGIHAVAGDASETGVLIQAHIARASLLVIATPDAARARRLIDIARMLNPSAGIVSRTHNEEEASMLRSVSGVAVFLGEHELARSMALRILETVPARQSAP
jgi:CPA2 family monovalent cation:H+ antiporter-2